MSKPVLPHGWGEIKNPALRTAIDAWATGWQPIETAPKDGTRVLLIDENDPTPGPVCTGWWMEGYWRDYGDIGCNGQDGYEPTHWMPLPFGPRATATDA